MKSKGQGRVTKLSFGKVVVINIGQLVTLRGHARPRVGPEMRELGIVENAALMIDGGRVLATGSYNELRDRMDADTTVIDAQSALVTPGFVDAHTHLVFGGNRAAEFEMRIDGATYQEIAAAGGGIQSTVAMTRAASEEELLVQARRHREWMLRGGTTTIEAKSGYGLDYETELRILRVLSRLQKEGPVRIVPTLLAAHTVPREMASRRAEYIEMIVRELLPVVAEEKLARYFDAFCDDHAFTVEETRVVLEAAKQRGLGLRIHAEQFRAGTGAALGAELHADTVDHLEMVAEETLLQLRKAGVQPVLLPASVFCLGRTQYPPARKMIELGLPIVLATDFNPGSSPAPSMLFTLSLACLQMRMLPAEALAAATINAAYSLDLGAEVGSLEPGKSADFLIHECRDYRELPYYADASMRPRVFVAGREVTP
jgi:imidazolonepropionase